MHINPTHCRFFPIVKMSVVRQRKRIINIFYSIPSSLFYSKIIQECTLHGISALSWHRILFLNNAIRAKATLVPPWTTRLFFAAITSKYALLRRRSRTWREKNMIRSSREEEEEEELLVVIVIHLVNNVIKSKQQQQQQQKQ